MMKRISPVEEQAGQSSEVLLERLQLFALGDCQLLHFAQEPVKQVVGLLVVSSLSLYPR